MLEDGGVHHGSCAKHKAEEDTEDWAGNEAYATKTWVYEYVHNL